MVTLSLAAAVVVVPFRRKETKMAGKEIRTDELFDYTDRCKKNLGNS